MNKELDLNKAANSGEYSKSHLDVLFPEKYYTPEQSEIYVGFECEQYLMKLGPDGRIYELPENREYRKLIIDEYSVGLSSTWYRVKLLDKEDIESLGWIYKRDNAGIEEIEFASLDDEYWLEYNLDDKYLRISWNNLEGDITRFSGTIKNKSELKKLMSQLKIKHE